MFGGIGFRAASLRSGLWTLRVVRFGSAVQVWGSGLRAVLAGWEAEALLGFEGEGGRERGKCQCNVFRAHGVNRIR